MSGNHMSLGTGRNIETVQSPHMVHRNECDPHLSNQKRQFLERCLDHPDLALFPYRQNHPLPTNAFENKLWFTFMSRFAKIAWFRKYAGFREAQSSLSQESLRLESFVHAILQRPNLRSMKDVLDLIHAGRRYSILCTGRRPDDYCFINEGYLFLLPHAIGPYPIEYALQEQELIGIRENLRLIGIRHIEASFSGRSCRLYELARRIIDQQMNLIDSQSYHPNLLSSGIGSRYRPEDEKYDDHVPLQGSSASTERPCPRRRGEPVAPPSSTEPSSSHLRSQPLAMITSQECTMDGLEQPTQGEQSSVDFDPVTAQNPLQRELLQTTTIPKQIIDLAEDQLPETGQEPVSLAPLHDLRYHRDAAVLNASANTQKQCPPPPPNSPRDQSERESPRLHARDILRESIKEKTSIKDGTIRELQRSRKFTYRPETDAALSLPQPFSST